MRTLFLFVVFLVVVLIALALRVRTTPPSYVERVMKPSEARSTIIAVNTALDLFKRDCGIFPSSAQGLAALFSSPGVSNWQGPYLHGARLFSIRGGILSSIGAWDGAAVCSLAITVFDEHNRPLKDTTVTLKFADFTGGLTKNQNLSNYHISTTNTDENGKCIIIHHFPAGGETYPFYRSGEIGFDAINVKAEHAGFASNEIAVKQFAGEHRNIHASRTITIPIKLTQPTAGGYRLEDSGKPQQ